MLDLFYKSNISAKLNAFLILPILTLLFFSSIAILDKYQKLEQTQNVLHFSQVVQHLSVLIYSLQKERGLSAGALSAENDSYQFELARQRKITISAYSRVSHVFTASPLYFTQKTVLNFQQIDHRFKHLQFIRAEIDTLIDNKFFDYYSLLISELLQEVNILHTMATNQETNYMVSSLIYALGFEEYAAIERGLLHGALNAQRNSDETLSLIPMRVLNHLARQEVELSRFYNVASVKHSALMFEAMHNEKTQEFHQYRESTVNVIKQRNSKLKQTANLIDPQLWWQLATLRLNQLNTVSSTIITDIIDLEKMANKQLKTPLVFYTLFVFGVLAIASFLSQILKGRLVDQIEHIADFMRRSRVSNQNNQLLDISGQDEIAEMANEFNQLMIERSANEKQLKLAAQFFTEAYDGIFITNIDGTITDVNPAFCQITGYERNEVLGKNPRILNSKKQNAEFYAEMWDSITGQGYWKGQIWNRKKNGEFYAELLTISSLKDNDGKIIHYMGIFTDITQIKKQHRDLEQMAHYDPLTLLPNRTLFLDRFNQAIAHADREKSSLAVCFIDLDNFKPINDNFGHSVGDKILVEVAKRIKSNLRNQDTVSRQGGDEFALLLGDVYNFSDCEDILKRIYNSLAQPFNVDGNCHNITASTGVTLYPHDHGDIDTLIRHADQAMYQVKLSGRHGYRLYNKEKDQQILNKQHQLNKIIEGIENEEFILFYQPKVNMKTGQVYGVEALIRWHSPEDGLVTPMEFLPILEGTNVDIQIGQWVINQAIKQLAQWQHDDLMIEVSINISSYHLQSPTFIEDLNDILNKYKDIDVSYLQLEVLESSVLGDLNIISNTLNICREELGLQVALDDFGTGYSSLTHIKSLPANIIKIDKSFIIDMLNDANNYNIIKGVLGLANSFSRDVIAEGVESTAHGLMLLMMGCDKAQGFGIARPMSANDFNDWLISYQPNKDWLYWANKNMHHKEIKLKLFDIALKHEFEEITKRITSYSTHSDEQVNQYQNTLCASWLTRKTRSILFCQSWLTELETAYQLMYQEAKALYQQQLNCDTDNTNSNIEKIKSLFDDVNVIMNSALKNANGVK